MSRAAYGMRHNRMGILRHYYAICWTCTPTNELFLLVAEGESVPGPTLQIGNTNSRYRFSIGPREFMDRWSKAGLSHHCTIGVGHVGDTIEKFAFLTGIPAVKICRPANAGNLRAMACKFLS